MRVFAVKLLLAMLFLPGMMLHSTTRLVKPGDDIVNAVAQIKPGDTLLFRQGTYTMADLLITKPMTLLAEGKVIFNAGAKGNILYITGNSVSIIGIEFRNTPSSFVNDNAAIKAENVNNLRIENCRLSNNFFGIYLARVNNSVIKNNRLTVVSGQVATSGNGIHLWDCRGNIIEGNTVTGHRDGIYLEFTRETELANNASRKNLRYGLHFMFSDTCTYTSNIFSGNGSGVAVMYSSHIIMDKNTFEDNNGPASYGLLLKDIRRSSITDNHLTGNTIGVFIEGSTKIEFRGNTFAANGTGLKMMTNSTDNTFIYNDFTGNSFDVTSNSRQNPNTYRNNYWDSYSGYDLNKDGIGDVPHHPVRLFSIITAKYPSSIILMRSFFSVLVDFTEKIFPELTPALLFDPEPMMRKNND